jgi:hypothetical protein
VRYPSGCEKFPVLSLFSALPFPQWLPAPVVVDCVADLSKSALLEGRISVL